MRIMLTLIFLILVIVIVWSITRTDPQAAQLQRDTQRDKQWQAYIASFYRAAKTKGEKRLIEAMMAGRTVDSFMGEAADAQGEPGAVPHQENARDAAPTIQSATGVANETAAITEPLETPKLSQPIDGTLLLLYFGAFLFVASAGLFVAFAGLSGVIRTLVVIATMVVLYGGGFWLYGRSSKLRPAGVTFVAIGMAIAPLVGVAVYHYLATGLDAKVIWFGTSILCMSMYAYAFKRLKKPLLSYLFIFSFISLFESAIGVLDLAVPYYLWGLIVVGMLLRFWGLFRKHKELIEPADVSAQVLVPLSAFVSLYLIQDHGVGQLSIALLLAAIYYSIEGYAARRQDPVPYAFAAHVLYVLSLATGTYAITEENLGVASALLLLTAIHSLALYAMPRQNVIANNGATVAFFALIPVLFLGWSNSMVVLLGLGAIAVFGMMVAERQRRIDMYVGGSLSLIALPIFIGQVVIESHLSLAQQSAASFSAVAVLYLVAMLSRLRSSGVVWHENTAAMYLFSGFVALVPAWIDRGWTALAATYVFTVTLVLLAHKTKEAIWWLTAGFAVCAPVLLELGQMHDLVFSLSVLLALVANLVFTIVCREEANRWLVAVLMLVAPAAFGEGGLGFTWDAVGYAYGYLGVTWALILSRSIARGVVFASSKIPVISYYRSASYSYVTGYVCAAGASVLISLTTSNSYIHTTAILGVLLLALFVLSMRVEKSQVLLVLAPWIAQGLLVSAIRPDDMQTTGNFVVLLSLFLAVSSYAAARQAQVYLNKAAPSVVAACLVTVYLPVFLGAFYDTADLILPAALAAAGGTTLYHLWFRTQAEREMSGAIIVAALMWALYVLGVDNLQAYTHIVAATLAGYAWWRYIRNDAAGSDSYLKAMFIVATVPLVLQALGGQSGDMYGWWLILEQVGFMILGIILHRRFLTWWGLYVAVGSVLYQLRELRWAALTVLALFIIGIAVYRLSRTPEGRPNSNGSGATKSTGK